MNDIERYAIKHKRLHPVLVDVLAPLFGGYEWHPSKARIKIISPWWGKLSGRGSATATFVIGNTIYIMRGALNNLKPVRNNNWNLASVSGFATFAHEVFHVYQNKRDGFGRFALSFVVGVFKSLRYSRKTYDHKFFAYEQEAIAFEKRLKTKVRTSDLQIFNSLR